jgi:integrase
MKEQFLEFDCNHNPTENFYKKLGKEEKDIVDKFEKYCLISANLSRAKKSRSNAIRFLIMVNKSIKNIGLEDLRDFLGVLKKSNFSDYYKNDVKGFVQRFLKWNFKDWSERFNNFEDIKFNSDAHRTKEIKSDDVITAENVKRLISKEKSLFWKTFIVLQYKGALRTLETRQAEWKNIDMEDADVYWLKVYSRKNRNGTEKERVVPLDTEAINLINELRKEQELDGIKTPYLFYSKDNPDTYVCSGTVSKWFSRLTKEVLGEKVKNYLLRHSRGEELHEAVRVGQLSKENAILVMGHSEKMFDKTYSHADKKKLKEVLKKQVLNIDYIAPEKKHILELKIEDQQKQLDKIQKQLDMMLDVGIPTLRKIKK